MSSSEALDAVGKVIETMRDLGCVDIESDVVTVGYNCVSAGLPGGGDVSVYVDNNGAEVVTSVPARGGWRRGSTPVHHAHVGWAVPALIKVAMDLRGAK